MNKPTGIRKFFKKLISVLEEIYLAWITDLPGNSGRKFRYMFYKKRLRYLGCNVIFEPGISITGMQYIQIGDDSILDKNCIIVHLHLDWIY
jgi:hypothetical protein